MPMTTLTTETLTSFSFDQLGTAYGIADAACIARPRGTGAYGRALAQRERISAEVERRGAIIRSNRYGSLDVTDVQFMCGRPSDFEPIR